MKKLTIGLAIAGMALPLSSQLWAEPGSSASASSIAEAFAGGSVKGDLRLRYESVDQSNALDDASALTLRTRLTYSTLDYGNWSAVLELEDARVVAGIDDYTVGPSGFNVGEYSVIADPESTELDQAYIQYKAEKLQAKIGRQVLTLDNHRFVGHVGWRQDRQTYDGLSLVLTPSDKLSFTYAFLDERNRIFADDADLDSKDHLLNLAYQSDLGKVTAYHYQLEVDEGADNSLETSGLRFSGSHQAETVKLLYGLEYATQSAEAATDFDARYQHLELGAVFKGFTLKAGQEVLGSDDGQYGFSTPLATLHKFNGWADQFLATPSVGLVDDYVSLSGKGPSGTFNGKWTLVYHDYSADESSANIDNLGSEWNAVYSHKFNKHYSAGLKYASYEAGDTAAAKVDAKKLWVWLGLNF